MALNREAKAVIIDDVLAQVGRAQSIVIAEYRGLKVGRITELRRQARKSGVYLRVLKNTLVRRAIAGSPFEKLSGHLAGPLIYGISADPVAPAKVLTDFAKTHEQLVIKGGALPNSVFDANGVKALASLPSREELLAKLLGTMQAPATTFVQTLNAVPAKFVRTVAALRDLREQAAA